jgi:dTDP-4-amino-4,6-dideoxygalactose transaminase
MPDVLAAMGLVEIKRYEQDTLVKRQSLYERYEEGLAGTPGLTLPIMNTADRIGSYHLFLLRLATGDRTKRDRIIELMNDRGVSLNVHYKPLPLLSIYRRMGYDMDSYPVSKDQFNRVISLPLFYDLELSDVDYICKNLKEVLEVVGI